MPENTVFASKPALGRRTLARAFAAGGAMPMGDRRRVYGADDVLRRRIERGDRGYRLARPAGSRWRPRRWRTGSRKLARPGGVHVLPDAGAGVGRFIRPGPGGGHKVDHRG